MQDSNQETSKIYQSSTPSIITTPNSINIKSTATATDVPISHSTTQTQQSKISSTIIDKQITLSEAITTDRSTIDQIGKTKKVILFY